MGDFVPRLRSNGRKRSWTDYISSEQKRYLVRELRRRHGDRCWLCGGIMMFDGEDTNHPLYRSLDHIETPTNRKMTGDIRNLRLAHRDCNSRRGSYKNDRTSE